MTMQVLDYTTTALLVMDYQNDVVELVPPDRRAGLLSHVRRIIEAARRTGVKVIYVTVSLRPGYPEVSARNPSFRKVRQGGILAKGQPGTDIHSALAPSSDDIVVRKCRVSAFAGSDLEVLLRALGITSIIVTGVLTSGVVLSTVREAADRDYSIMVASDACDDIDSRTHQFLVDTIFPQQATVLVTDDLLNAFVGETLNKSTDHALGRKGAPS